MGFVPYQHGDDRVPYDLGASSLPTIWSALVALGPERLPAEHKGAEAYYLLPIPKLQSLCSNDVR